jgi:outer membrane receptor for ferrienterochelin and colicins
MASYLYLDVTEEAGVNGDKQKMALTMQHSAGFEAYHTSPHRLNNNPYMNESKPYWHLGLMGEITMGHVSWFINRKIY